MLPHVDAATERTRGRKANRLTALEYTRAVDPAVLTELKRAKANSLTGLHKQQRTARFRRFVNSASLDRFLLVHARLASPARWGRSVRRSIAPIHLSARRCVGRSVG